MSPAAIDLCVYNAKLPETEKMQSYVLTGDPGFEKDNYAITLGHLDKQNNVIVDLAVKFEPPLNIIKIENFYEDLCKRYNVVDVCLDKHLSMATIQRLYDIGLPSRGVSFGARTDVKLYQNLLELVNVQKIKLPKCTYIYKGDVIEESDALLTELKFLQRVVLADRYRVEASPGHTDDLADAVALLAYTLNVERRQGGEVLF